MVKEFSHYSIIGKIGAGGMGEVYLAEDSRLGRKVAIKFLTEAYTNDEDRVRRFSHEARSASALNHPNIITIHDIGAVEGQHYMATEYVEGETLRRLISLGPVPLTDALDIAIQAASALSAAHSTGIIHRDIKPENIMRRPDGYIKILDFGLAKLNEQASGEISGATRSIFETAPGVVMGTVAYMSPEQARGLPLDGRSDLFSLGVVLYELVTGQRPFAGETASDMIVAILDREPPPPSETIRGVPPQLDEVLAKLLSKDVASRYQTGTDLAADLKRIKAHLEMGSSASLFEAATAALSSASGADAFATTRQPAASGSAGAVPVEGSKIGLVSTRGRRAMIIGLIGVLLVIGAGAVIYTRFFALRRVDSVAVLPFINEGADAGTEYLTDGITEGLINSLAQVPDLSVMSRNSVFRFKGKEADAQQVGRDLSVDSVLIGRVRKEGDELVVNAELVDSRNSHQIWGEQFRRKASDLMGLQEQIVSSISSRIRRRLSASQVEAMTHRQTNSAEAYDSYLRGRYYWNIGTNAGLRQADQYFERAASLDPTYSLALAGCAGTHAFASDELEKPLESMRKAKLGALSALKRDEGLAVAHLTLARVSWMYDRDYATAERKFKRAIELDPSDPRAHEQFAMFLAYVGRGKEARPEIDRARQLDPTSARIMQTAGRLYYFERRYDEAIDLLEQAAKHDPKLASVHEWSALVFEQKNMRLEAIEQYLRERVLSTTLPDDTAELKTAYIKSGWEGFWRLELSYLKEQSKSVYISATRLADVYLRLGDKEQALAWLGRGIDEHDNRAISLNVDPRYDGLRGDPRFEELAKRVRQAP